MELKFKRQYISKKQYAVGEIDVFLGYAMEVTDLRTKLQDGKLEPGESCMLLFGITPEEYAWKDADTAKLDKLANDLRKNVPADRLIACQARSILGKKVARAVKPVTTDSIDDGAFARLIAEKMKQNGGPMDRELLECRRLQNLCRDKNVPEGVKVDFAAAKREVCAKLRTLDKIYAAYDTFIKGEWPSIGYDLHVELFTTLKRAENMQQRMKEAHAGMDKWKIHEIPGAEFEAFILKLADDGVNALRIDNGFAAAEVNIADLYSGAVPENANLRLKLISEVQFALRWKYLKDNGADQKVINPALESMLTLRNLSGWQLGNALLYAICIENNSGEGVLCTPEAAKKLDANVKKRITPAVQNVMLNEPGGKKRFMAVFTSPLRAATLCERMNENAVPVAMTFDDLAARAQAADGLIIDPESLSYRVMKEEFDRIRDLRSKQPQIVRVKADDAPVQNAVQAENASDDSMGDLPDPDALDTAKTESAKPEKTESAAIEAPQALEADESSSPDQDKKGKRGFFRKFFGK